jgi:hypothetical protein
VTGERKSVEVSRRIEAPAAFIFEIVANPQRHTEFDGFDMLRGAVGRYGAARHSRRSERSPPEPERCLGAETRVA